MFQILVVAFAVSCCMMLFVSTLADTMGLSFTEQNIAAAAKITFGNVWWPAYLLYVLSAYSLTALCAKLPSAGAGEGWEYFLNLATGCAVCLLTVSMGIYMIRRANREIRKLQENDHGEYFL